MAFNPDKCLKIINRYNDDNWVHVDYDSDTLPTIYFSKTGADGTWKADRINLGVGESAYIKGTGPTAISDDVSSIITTLGPYDLSGQITSLLNDGEGGDVPLTQPYCFANLFIGYGNPRVINIAQDMFPSTVLSPYCYAYMFSTTETLETPKPIILPAENLVEGCYYYMFNKSYKVTQLQVNFKNWDQAPNATTNWVQNITTTGKLFCPDELPEQHGNNYIPSNWTKEAIPEPDPFPETMLRFEVLADNCTISLAPSKIDNSSYYFSTDNVNWVPDTITANKGDFVAVKGSNYPKGSNIIITQAVNVYGSVMSLVDGIGEQTEITQSYAFQDLFWYSGVPMVVKGNLLSATKLTERCYYRMFFKNSGLIALPENLLPATAILADYCCCNMFSYCVNLISISGNLLPTTTLAPECYYCMFSYCDGLTSVPENLLPATVLKYRCYYEMFWDCNGIISIPENLLPATTLEAGCYQQMFHGCDGLTSIPEKLLPATILASECYYEMFRGCISLTSIPEKLLPATTLKSSCYEGMFEYCKGLTSIPKKLLPATTLDFYCYTSMFEDCSAIKTPPDLPAMVLNDYCYKDMFNRCSSLEYTPELPAMTLGRYCYENMFQNCSKINIMPKLPAKTAKEYCYLQMFHSTGITEVAADKIALTTFAKGCCHGMFTCSELTKLTIPDVPPDKSDVYGYMCYGCSSLNEVTYLGRNWGYTGSPTAFNNWMGGDVPSIGTFYCTPSLPITLDIHHIHPGWTVSAPPTPTQLLFKKKAKTNTKIKFIFLNMNDETNRTKIIAIEDDSFTLPLDPPFTSIPGNVFKGWSLTPYGSLLPSSSPVAITGSTYIYARYDITLTLEPGIGTGTPISETRSQTGNYVLPIDSQGFVAPYNSTFDGWSRTPDGPKIEESSITLAKSTTLYAHWKSGYEGWIQLVDYPDSVSVTSPVKIHEYNDSSKLYIANGAEYVYNRFALTGIQVSGSPVAVTALPNTADANKIYALTQNGSTTYWHFEYNIMKEYGELPVRKDGNIWIVPRLLGSDAPLIDDNSEETFYLNSQQRIYFYNFMTEAWEKQNNTIGEIVPYEEYSIDEIELIKTPDQIENKFYRFSQVLNGYTHYCWGRLIDKEHYKPPRPTMDPTIYWIIDTDGILWVSVHPLIANNIEYEGKFSSDWEPTIIGTDGPWKKYKDKITEVHILEDITPKNFAHWFDWFDNLKKFVGLEHLRTDYSKSFGSSFGVIGKYFEETELDFTMINTDSAETLISCFIHPDLNGGKYTSIDISSWNTPHVIETDGMFSGSPYLEHIYVGDGWDVSKVTSKKSQNMFADCKKLHNWNSRYIDRTKAIIDNGTNGGYLERKEVVSFDPNGGRGAAFKKYILKNRTLTLPACPFTPAEDQNVFLGWSTSEDKEDIITTDSIVITGDITLYAIWTENT